MNRYEFTGNIEILNKTVELFVGLGKFIRGDLHKVKDGKKPSSLYKKKKPVHFFSQIVR